MWYNLFVPPRGVCHTATAVAVFVYVCTTNLHVLTGAYLLLLWYAQGHSA